ncbi:MAG TPA: GGDEF domain-containing response regulator [Candidatus Sulfotelmatobacter sp.]|nr:GGDEF domain-containing response regulator [Candidatus Sulfotelmatobacter sp.]
MSVERLKLLLAEPSGRNGTSLNHALAGTDFDIETAFNGGQALVALGNGTFDCALIDSHLPAFDEIGALREIRGRGVGMPIVVVVDSNDTQRSRNLIEAGASDCLLRHEVTPERLSLSLWNAVRSHRAFRQIAASEQRLTQQLLYDQLTRLPNRTLFFDRLEQALATARRTQSQVAMLLLDLNDFNTINQTFGYRIGDRLLEIAASRLTGVLRDSDSVARIGDDEFAALLPTGASEAGAVKAAGKLLENMNRVFAIDEHRFTVASAIGIALFPLHAGTADELVRCAETALRAAKRNGVGYSVYTADDGTDHGKQLSLAHELRQAITGNQFLLHYQPKIDMQTGQVSGVEALVRWRHPTQGLLFPDTFIPVAEQIGVIEGLTRWVLNAALEQFARWQNQGRDLSVSVNLSALSLHNHEIGDTVEKLLETWQVPASRLVLEITESAIISHLARASETLGRLHALGVRVAIDDFGTGYTSLAYLRKLPVNELKIDKSFVMNMLRINDDAVIVRTIIELAHNLGLQVVAEGVEDAATWQALRELGCNIAQGYHMSRPIDAQALDTWLSESEWGLSPARSLSAAGIERQRALGKAKVYRL